MGAEISPFSTFPHPEPNTPNHTQIQDALLAPAYPLSRSEALTAARAQDPKLSFLTPRQRVVVETLDRGYGEPQSGAQLARDMNISESRISKLKKSAYKRVYKFLAPEEKPAPKPKKKRGRPSLLDELGPEARAILVNLRLKQKLALEQIAAQLNTTSGTISRTLKNLGIRANLTLAQKLGENPQDALAGLYWIDGLSEAEIGIIFGCTKDNVRIMMKKLNIPNRKPLRGDNLKDYL